MSIVGWDKHVKFCARYKVGEFDGYIKEGEALLERPIANTEEKDQLWTAFKRWDSRNYEAIAAAFSVRYHVHEHRYKFTQIIDIDVFTPGYRPPSENLETQVNEVKQSIRVQLEKLRTFRDAIDLQQVDPKVTSRPMHGQIEHKDRHVPMKGYILYAYAQPFESYFLSILNEEIPIKQYVESLIGVLSRTGLRDAAIHQAETFIAISYGDLALRFDLADFSKRSYVNLNSLDYAGGPTVASYAEGLKTDQALVEGFRQHKLNKTFHSNYAIESYS